MNANLTAKDAIKQLIQITGIRRIIFVDDLFEEMNLQKVTELTVSLTPDTRRTITGFENIPFEEDFSSWLGILEQIWNDADREKQTSIFRELLDKNPQTQVQGETPAESTLGTYDLDTEAASILKTLVPDDSAFKELGPTEWDSKRTKILSECKSQKTLFLFDEDLTKAGKGPTAGRDYIRSVLTDTQPDEALCGLISHKFGSAGEFEVFENFKKPEFNLDQNRVVPLSKANLRDDPIGFARRLRLTAVNPLSAQLKERVFEIEGKANGVAKTKIDEINVYTFDKIIFQAPNREGIWETETLFRLYDMFQRKEARRDAADDVKLNELAAQIRKISQIIPSMESAELPLPCDTGADSLTSGATQAPQVDEAVSSSVITLVDHDAGDFDARLIQRGELYEESGHLNSHHLPLDLGDIFEKTSGDGIGRKYLLLTQPCDLMVRPSDGARRGAITDALLAEIKDEVAVDDLGNCMPSESYYELPYFDETSLTSKYVNFRLTHCVRLLVLDLCVFDDHGFSTFSIDVPCAENMLLAWKARHEKVKRKVEEVLTVYQKLFEVKKHGVPDEMRRAIGVPKSTDKSLFAGTFDTRTKTLSYDVKRTGRLSQIHSTAALLKYANYMSRPAFDLDLGK